MVVPNRPPSHDAAFGRGEGGRMEGGGKVRCGGGRVGGCTLMEGEGWRSKGMCDRSARHSRKYRTSRCRARHGPSDEGRIPTLSTDAQSFCQRCTRTIFSSRSDYLHQIALLCESLVFSVDSVGCHLIFLDVDTSIDRCCSINHMTSPDSFK